MDSFIANNNNGDEKSVIRSSYHQRLTSEVILTTDNFFGEEAGSPDPIQSLLDVNFSSMLPPQAGITDPELTITDNVNQHTMLLVQQNINQGPTILTQNINQGSAILTEDGLKQGSMILPQHNVNQESVVLTQQNVNQEMLVSRNHDAEMLRSAAKILEEDEETNGERISDTLTTRFSQKRKPGVILLGRGNSFSLGRSEVMLLHADRQNTADTKRIDNRKYRSSSSSQDAHNLQNNNTNIHSWNNGNLNQTGLVAPLYNHAPGAISVQGTTNKFVPVDLETLWQKAELIMAAKETVVQQVLEEFGIGETGGEGEVSVEKVMEENIWQAVQDSFQT